jgi:hypothetical protein
MGRYDEQAHDLHHTLSCAGIAANIERSVFDEYMIFVAMPGGDNRKLAINPTDDGCYEIELWTDDLPVIESVAENVGDNFAAAIVTGLLLANLPPATTRERIYYRHEHNAILLVENGEATAQLAGHAFADPIACTIVAMLNAAIRAGRETGGNSRFWIDGIDGDHRVYVQHGPDGPKQTLVVEGLSSEAISSLVFELNGASQMGAYT